MRLSLDQITAAIGGRLAGPDAPVVGPAVTDPRQVAEGLLFVAMHGERTDGHAHLGSARDLDTVGAIVSDLEAACSRLSQGQVKEVLIGLVLVGDTVATPDALARTHLEALRQVAAEQGDRLAVVAMIGLVGKTTTKDLACQLLIASDPTVAPRVSFNNEIGLPLTVLETDESTHYPVLEMGVSGPGHIVYLTDIAPLDTTGVLMIGHAHMDGLDSIKGVTAVKAEITAGLRPEEIAILNADGARATAMAEPAPVRVLTFSARGRRADLRIENVDLDAATQAAFDLHLPGLAKPRRIQLTVAGVHNVSNALVTVGLVLTAGLTPELIADRLGSVSIENPHRMDTSELSGDLLLIDDSYDANIDFITTALTVLPTLTGDRRRVVVISRVPELGESSTTDHVCAGELTARAEATMLIGVGSTQGTLETARARGVGVVSFGDTTTAISQIDAPLYDGDTVLVKSSNGSGAWHLTDHLKKVHPR